MTTPRHRLTIAQAGKLKKLAREYAVAMAVSGLDPDEEGDDAEAVREEGRAKARLYLYIDQLTAPSAVSPGRTET